MVDDGLLCMFDDFVNVVFMEFIGRGEASAEFASRSRIERVNINLV